VIELDESKFFDYAYLWDMTDPVNYYVRSQLYAQMMGWTS
jgi:hypothetical protein